MILIDAFLGAKTVDVMRKICPQRNKRLVHNEYATPRTFKLYPGTAFE